MYIIIEGFNGNNSNLFFKLQEQSDLKVTRAVWFKSYKSSLIYKLQEQSDLLVTRVIWFKSYKSFVHQWICPKLKKRDIYFMQLQDV